MRSDQLDAMLRLSTRGQIVAATGRRMSGEKGRQRLRDLSSRLVRLHTLLLDGERRVHEHAHGPVEPAHLLQAVIHHEQFAWLRALSALIARIDEALDDDEAAGPADVESFVREVQRLLRSGADGTFERKYLAALQDSPDVVMAHAEVVKVLRAGVEQTLEDLRAGRFVRDEPRDE